MVNERKYSGKWYFELKLGALTSGGVGIGVWEPVVSGAAGARYYAVDATNSTYSTGIGTPYATPPYGGAAWAAGGVIGVAVDLDNSKIWFSRNGVYIAGDPAAGTTPAYGVGSSTGIAFAAANGMGWHPVASWNTADANTSTIQLLSKTQTYSPPSGFTAWGDSKRTLSPENKSTSATLSNSNRTIADAASTHLTGAYCDEGITNRKIYFEAKFDTPGAAGRTAVGVAVQHNLAENTIADFKAFNGTAGSGADQICVTDEGKVYERNVLKYTGTAFSSGDTCMFAFDSSTGNVWVGQNGTWFNGGNPAAGTGVVHTATGTSNKTYHAACKANNSAGAWQATVNFGSAAPTYAVPTGFSMMGVWRDAVAANVAIAAPLASMRRIVRTLNAAVSAATTFTPSLRFFRSLNAAVNAATALTTKKLLFALLPANVAAQTAMTPKAILHAALSTGVVALANLDILDGLYTGWVCNLDNGAHSMYQGFNFNSFAALNGAYYAARSDGLYLLGGTSDNGAQITPVIRTGADNHDSAQQKRIPVAYLGIRANGTVMLKTITDGNINTYNLTAANATIAEARVKPGQGLRANYWQFEVANVSSADFELESVQVFPVILQRRVK
jgi:hypothetical protein